ncbi:hypothetical protein EHP00_148 [Ecytonucleospora hepatopenaei]|uniref:Uncharacterized protein n=1 Tax=Ecytonucleospora hepatopenaei TaxID=646526 RepID=A0A1W0E5X7_9MICR|nr:hypothetical protein EHP00_148 [Ecytonucleospora hepatopenaei]
MKHSHKLHGAIITGAITFMFLMIDLGIYMGTGKSKLLEFSSGLKMFIVRKTHYVTKFQRITNQLNAIEDKIDEISHKIDEHEIQHHNKTKAEVSINNLLNIKGRRKPEVAKTKIETAAFDTNDLKVKALRANKINVFKNLPATISQTTDVKEIMEQNPQIDFNSTFLTVRKFNSQKEAHEFHEKARNNQIEPEDEAKAHTTALNLKEVIESAKTMTNGQGKPLVPFANTLNQIGFEEEKLQKKNGVAFPKNKKKAHEIVSPEQVKMEPTKTNIKITKPISKNASEGVLIPNDNEDKFKRPSLEELKEKAQSKQKKNAEKQNEQRLRLKTAFKKAQAHMLEEQIINQQKILRRQKKALRREAAKRAHEFEVFQSLKAENQKIAKTNNDVIKMSQVLLQNIENASHKLEETEEKFRKETQKLNELSKQKKKNENESKVNLKNKEAKNQVKSVLDNEDDKLLAQLEEAKKELKNKVKTQ